MRKKLALLLTSMTFCAGAHAQVTSCATFLKASQPSDVVVPFRYNDEGEQTPIEWGLDLAWLSEDNVRTGVFYAGKDLIDVVRLSFEPSASVEDGAFSDDQITDLTSRASIVKTWLKSGVGYYLNDDHTTVDSWYNSTLSDYSGRAERWAKLIDMTARWYKSYGLTNLVAIAPFNEPDYGWDQGYNSTTRPTDFLNICKLLREGDDYKDLYADVRLCGGNTLNDDYAYTWWNNLKDYLDDGNTHQLAGTFDNYASFFETVRAYGHHATADELHNVMECMVGVEYGMQTGIWWGTCEYTRSQFMKATYQGNPGDRLAYGEHRDNWTSASVYRQPDGLVQAFGGMSERQSYTTAYDFACLDQPVWYNGERGRNYLMYLPGGTGYQTGQTSAEVCVDVQGGDDVRPVINGTYKIMNVNSGLVLGFASSPSTSWTSVTQRKNSNTYKCLQWIVTPIQESGDFSYYKFELNTGKDLLLDILDWDYTDGADVGSYPGSFGTNESWYLEYAGNGAFYIRSRYSAKCLEVVDGKTTSGANVQMGDYDGEAYQQWRFIATTTTPDLEAPVAPSGLEATAQNASVKLTWQPSSSNDLMEYVVVRNGVALAKGLSECEFTDNEAEQDSSYTYYVYALDKSYNRSDASNKVTGCAINDEKGLVMHLTFDEDFYDITDNGNHVALYGDTVFLSNGDHNGLSLSGTENFLQLPYTVASHDAMTVSCWIYYRGGNTWQRVFDFGNGTDQYMFLTTNGGSGPRFAIKNGGDEEVVDAGSTLVSNKWYHIAVTIGDGTACLYVNGELKNSNESMTIRPSDIRPVLNYIGRSQYSADPYMRAYIDDFQIYNYALSAEEISNVITAVDDITVDEDGQTQSGVEYDLSGRRATNARGIVIRDGKKVLK